jgi:hypothetical protein
MRFDPVPTWPRWAKITAAAVGALFVVGAIGALGDDGEPSPAAGAAGTKTTEPKTKAVEATTAKAADECVAVPTSIGKAIATGSEADPIKFTSLGGWKSTDYANVYFIAGTWDVQGVGPTTGIWATNHIDKAGLIMAVDGEAQQFTTWPDADSTDAEISKADPGVKKATECLR